MELKKITETYILLGLAMLAYKRAKVVDTRLEKLCAFVTFFVTATLALIIITVSFI